MSFTTYQVYWTFIAQIKILLAAYPKLSTFFQNASGSIIGCTCLGSLGLAATNRIA
jgi:hypothetical protein